MNVFYRQLLSWMAAATCLSLLSMTTAYHFGFLLVMSAVVGLGTYFCIPGKKDAFEIDPASGVTQGELDHALSVMDGFIRKFRILETSSTDEALQTALADILETLAAIREHFSRDPGDLRNADLFLKEYLGRAHSIFTQYIHLSNHRHDGNIEAQLRIVQKNISTIQAGFRSFYRRCLQNNLIDLEVDSDTLTSLMDMDIPTPPSESLPRERSNS